MNGFDLVRLQPNQVKKAGDTMTGDLTMTGAEVKGNATSSTKLKDIRTFTIGNSPAKPFDGTANVEFTLQEIGIGGSAGFKKEITSDQWQVESDYYKIEIIHNLNSDMVIVGAIDTDTKESVFLPYKIIDNNKLDIQTKDNTLNLTVVIAGHGLSAAPYNKNSGLEKTLRQAINEIETLKQEIEVLKSK